MQNANFETEDISDGRIRLDPANEPPGAQEDAVRTAERGRRAARTASIIAAIDSGFSDQQFSTRALAGKLGLSARYVQDLAKEGGFSITDRILALRLQKAHATLMNDRGCMLKISDVAWTCGFNEVSHFHRCFRRRFGAAPAQLRTKAVAAK